jgi:hypothetical protein
MLESSRERNCGVREVFDPSSVSDLVSHEYVVIQNNLEVYRRLFKYKYREALGGNQLAVFVGFDSYSALASSGTEAVLEKWLAVAMGGVFRSDHLGHICPDCLTETLRMIGKNGDDIKKTCEVCGGEVDDMVSDIDDFDQSLSRDVTYAPVPHSSYCGLGCTFHPKNTANVKDHRNYMYKLANSNNVLFSDFAEEFPELAAELDAGAYMVQFGEYVFCRMGAFVRKAPVSEVFDVVEGFWHRYDAMLRMQKLTLQMDAKGKFSREKIIAMSLCTHYGFDVSKEDQAFINSVGLEIERFKPFVEAREHHVSAKTLAETVFYINLLVFNKTGLASKVKSDLDIDLGLVNFYDKVKMILQNDAVAEDTSSVLLDASERANELRATVPSS